MRTAVTDDVIRSLLRTTRCDPLTELAEDEGWWRFRTFAISTHRAVYSTGWTFSLRPESRLYKRWFDFPDMGLRGWAIIFRVFDPIGEPDQMYELFPGWVLPEQEEQADRWIKFLNALIRSYFSSAKPPPTTPAPPPAAPATDKRTLKLIGNFREMGWDELGAPSLVALRGKRSAGHKAEVVKYLRKAESISLSPGFERDFFDETQYIGTPTMRTDGVYVWPDFLAGYVERHDVALPDDFERQMEQRQWTPPEKLDRAAFKAPWD